MEDDETWLYGDDQSAEASAETDIKENNDVSIYGRIIVYGVVQAQNFYKSATPAILFIEFRLLINFNIQGK